MRDGLIRPTIDPAVLGPDPEHRAIPAGAYVMETPRGTRHPFFIDPANCDLIRGTPHIKASLEPADLANLRGTIVHEATHALQDWMRHTLDPRTAEGSAYLAGAITRRLWGYRIGIPVVNPRAGGLAYSLMLADRFLAEPDPHRRYVIPSHDVLALNDLVTTGTVSRYVFNGI